MSGRGNGVVEIAEIIRVILLVTFFHLGYPFQCVLNSRLSTICTGWQFPAVQKLRGKRSGKACRAVARALIGGVYIHIFVLCPTNFF